MKVLTPLLAVLATLVTPGVAPADDTDLTPPQAYYACRDGMTETDPSKLLYIDGHCMVAAQGYEKYAHNAALAKNWYDRDRFRLLSGTAYVGAGEIEMRTGDTGDAKDQFLKGATLLKEVLKSSYPDLARQAEHVLEVSTGH